MSIALPDGLSIDRVIDTIVACERAGAAELDIHAELRALGLSCGDSDLAIDRVMGGLVRAATGNPLNEPSKENDPIAWTSYHRGLLDPELLVLVEPPESHSAPPAAQPVAKPWWRFWG